MLLRKADFRKRFSLNILSIFFFLGFGLITTFVTRSIKVGKILKVCALDLEPTLNYPKIISFLRKLSQRP